jgi:hypothetical protein
MHFASNRKGLNVDLQEGLCFVELVIAIRISVYVIDHDCI